MSASSPSSPSQALGCNADVVPPLPSRDGGSKRKAGVGVMDRLEGGSSKRQATGYDDDDDQQGRKDEVIVARLCSVLEYKICVTVNNTTVSLQCMVGHLYI